MSVARFARAAPRRLLARRTLATDAHHHDHHGPADTNEYPKATVFTSTSRNFALGLAGFCAWLWFGPDAAEDFRVTRAIKSAMASQAQLAEVNSAMYAKRVAASEDKLLFNSATQPHIHRLRAPMIMDVASAYSAPVGSQDMSAIKPKRAGEY
ncbi:hypothetical protein BD626DRAFT_563402 [Schizophyllum amplum]|uniref:Uncharacterized protein n=1 Tax=Schizophyllum amplum TaxID=97359 RepID=A0A550CY18_9AGAR|nr:hypothetical protein BD626DRAFT_563402 [Auriculariopsis ampla]